MPSTRYIIKPSLRQKLTCMFALLALSLALAVALPVAKALGVGTGDITLGILVIDSENGGGQSQGGSDTGKIKLSIRVINSATYTLTLDKNDGTSSTSVVKAAYYKPLVSITPPERTGYTFQGYYDEITGGNQYYDSDGKGVGVWDKDSDTILYAHWTLILDFTFPSDALVQIDAAGNVTGQEDFTFSSGTVKPLKITAVKGAPTATAASLFAKGTIPDGLRILLTPKVGSSDEVKVPLNSAATSISNGGWTLAAGSTTNPTKFAVAFSLFLPSGTQLNYFPNGDVSIANLSYVVEAVDAS